VDRLMYRCFQYGYADGCFWIGQDRHMLYLSFGVERPTTHWPFQINCTTPDEAGRLYDAVGREPLVVNHLSIQRAASAATG